jgi:nucleoside-triphosphatase
MKQSKNGYGRGDDARGHLFHSEPESALFLGCPRSCAIRGSGCTLKGMAQCNLLITGLPGTGKTTLITRLAERLRGVNVTGFYTEELRTGGVRKGFEIIDLGGSRALLSHIDLQGGQRVGRYGVDVAGFERYLEAVPFFSPSTELVIVDEIGRMECLSVKFTRLIVDLLDAPVTVVATIALHGGGIIERIKNRADVRLYRVTKDNRDNLVEGIENAVRESLAGRK